jgi:hypothetical protein
MDKLRRAAKIKAERLEQLAFQIKYPITPEVRGAISRGTHGTTPLYSHTLTLREASEARRRQKMKYRREVGEYKIMERAKTCSPDVATHSLRRANTFPKRPPETPQTHVRSLSEAALEGLSRMVWKLEDQYPTLSQAFKAFDLDRSGSIQSSEFRAMLERMNLEIEPDTIDEIMQYIDVSNDGQIELYEMQMAIHEVLKEQNTKHWMDRTKQYSMDITECKKKKKQDLVEESTPVHVIVESVNMKCLDRLPEMQEHFNMMRKTSFSALTSNIQGVPLRSVSVPELQE